MAVFEDSHPRPHTSAPSTPITTTHRRLHSTHTKHPHAMSVSKTPGKKPLAHFHSFIASIPDDKVVGGNSSGTLHSTKDYRFDLQGVSCLSVL